MNHEDYKEMIELEALGALEEADSRALQEHLTTCNECRAELSELRDVAAELIHLTAPVAAPAGLRARILETVRAQKKAQQSSGVHAVDENEKVESGGPSPVTSEAVPFSALKGRRWGTVSNPGALAASIVIAALVVLLIIFWNRNRTLQADLVRLSTRNEEMQAELTRLSQRNNELLVELNRVSDNNNELQAEIASRTNRGNQQRDTGTDRPSVIAPPTLPATPEATTPDARTVALTGSKKAPGARASLLYDNGKGVIALTVSDLPPAPAGKAYQLWFMVKGRPVPGNVFRTGPEGRAMLSGQIPPAARNATAFNVTLEPANGSSAPTGEKYLL